MTFHTALTTVCVGCAYDENNVTNNAEKCITYSKLITSNYFKLLLMYCICEHSIKTGQCKIQRAFRLQEPRRTIYKHMLYDIPPSILMCY